MGFVRALWRGSCRLVAMLVAVLVVDVLLTRFVLPDSVIQRTEQERHSRVYSPIYHHGLAANKVISRAGWGLREYTFATNSLGFKDHEPREIPLAGERKRLVIIGDSFTEGSGYAASQTFVGHVTATLAAEGVEVFNAGVIGYSPAIYYRRVRHLIEQGLRFDGLAVFIDISDVDDEANQVVLDERDNVVKRGLGPLEVTMDAWLNRAKTFLKQSSISYRFLSELNRSRKRSITHENQCLAAAAANGNDATKIDRELLMPGLMRPRATWTFDAAVYEEWGKRGLEIAGENMDRLHNLLQSHSIPLTVVVYPWPAQIFEGDLDSRQVRFWREWAARNDAQFIDLFPVFVGADAPMETYARYFIPCDNHWNEAGHRRVAEAFLAGYRR